MISKIRALAVPSSRREWIPGNSSPQMPFVRAHEDKTYSLCDAMSFVVMERLNIADAIAFDRHFAEYGRFALL
jgi:hypothetical protein